MTHTSTPPARRWLPLLAAASLGGTAACAPPLSSHVTAVSVLASVQSLPLMHESDDTASTVAKLMQQPLTADTSVKLALLNNRELRAQLHELGVPAGQLVSAGLIANPSFEIELLPERDSHYELRAEYNLMSIIMAPLRRRAAQDELDAARLSTAAAVVEVGYQARARFYALQAATARLLLARQALEGLAAARDAAQALQQAGNVRPLEAAAQLAAYERAQADLATYELELTSRREELQRFLGLASQLQRWSSVAPLPAAPAQPLAVDDLETRAVAANLDLQALQKRLGGLTNQRSVVSTQAWLPELNADVHALRVDAEGGEARNLWRWGAGVSVEVPLFDRKQGRLAVLQAQHAATRERYQGLRVSLRSQARDLQSRMSTAQARATQYATVVLPAQREVLQQTLLQYNAMQLGVFQLLSARRELLQTELAYADLLRDYWTVRAELDALSHGRAVRRTQEMTNAATLESNQDTGGH